MPQQGNRKARDEAAKAMGVSPARPLPYHAPAARASGHVAQRSTHWTASDSCGSMDAMETATPSTNSVIPTEYLSLGSPRRKSPPETSFLNEEVASPVPPRVKSPNHRCRAALIPTNPPYRHPLAGGLADMLQILGETRAV